MVALRVMLLLWIINFYAQDRSRSTQGSQARIPMWSTKNLSKCREGAGLDLLGCICWLPGPYQRDTMKQHPPSSPSAPYLLPPAAHLCRLLLTAGHTAHTRHKATGGRHQRVSPSSCFSSQIFWKQTHSRGAEDCSADCQQFCFYESQASRK